jgi:hypothetical protein
MEGADQIEYGFATAIFVMEHVAEKISPGDADRGFGETSKENFWRVWPVVRAWGEELWRTLEDERGHMARPAIDDDLDDVGGGG